MEQAEVSWLIMLQLSDWWRLVAEFDQARGHAALSVGAGVLEVR